MSCDITNGRVEECKDSVSGLKAIYFANFDDLDTDNITYDGTHGDVIDTWQPASPITLYKYELKSNENSFTTAVQTSRDNGTTFFEQTLQISLKKQDFAMHKNIKLLAYGRPRIIVRTMTDQFFLMGLAQGCDTTAGEISSGAALGDFNGYKLTFVASEVLPANFIDITSQGELQVAFADSAGTAATITTT
jgi:hypothetical protein|tara:strand:+ start:11187 stop:11759 length:573 start_codon:yes stop_codon:yes gene_type:complete